MRDEAVIVYRVADELDLFETAERWADAQADVHAVAVVGSHARGAAGPTSDVELVIVVDDVEPRLSDQSWLGDFGEVDDVTREDWALVQSLRVGYRDGLEVEFGLTSPRWAKPPLDAGTAAVIRDGFRVLFDPAEIACCFSAGMIPTGQTATSGSLRGRRRARRDRGGSRRARGTRRSGAGLDWPGPGGPSMSYWLPMRRSTRKNSANSSNGWTQKRYADVNSRYHAATRPSVPDA